MRTPVFFESRHYLMKSDYEEVWLYSKKTGEPMTRVGDHYGDPSDGIIDTNERFCVTVGCGCVIYYLRRPFKPYSYSAITPQWTEFGRGPENIRWIEKVWQTAADEIAIQDENGVTERIRVGL